MEVKQKEYILNKPKTVVIAIRVFYISLAIFILESLVEIAQSPKSPRLFFIVASFIYIGLAWFLIYMIGKGKNWARIVFLMVAILNVLNTLTALIVAPLLLNLLKNLPQILTGITQTVIQITVSVLLFQKPSSVWFNVDETKTGSIKFTENTLILLSVSWLLLLFYFLSDGAQSIWDYSFYVDGLKIIAAIFFVFLFLYLEIKGFHFQSVFALLRRPVVYVVFLSFLGNYLLNTYMDVPFEIRFRLSQRALESFAEHPVLDNERSTVQWVGLFPLREVDVAGTSVRMIVSECHLFDDCGFVYSPNGEPPIVGEDYYSKIPFAENWYYWWRSW